MRLCKVRSMCACKQADIDRRFAKLGCVAFANFAEINSLDTHYSHRLQYWFFGARRSSKTSKDARTGSKHVKRRTVSWDGPMARSIPSLESALIFEGCVQELCNHIQAAGWRYLYTAVVRFNLYHVPVANL